MEFILQASLVLWVEGVVDEAKAPFKQTLMPLSSVPRPPRSREAEERSRGKESRSTHQNGSQTPQADRARKSVLTTEVVFGRGC
jgi:hypothetical protein